MLRSSGKKKHNKVELYPAELWDWKKPHGLKNGKKYRVRANGKWFSPNGKIEFFWSTEIKNIIWRSIKKYI